MNSNESFDISNNVKVNVLRVSLPSIGGKKIGGIHNRVVPDIQCFTKQKKSNITMHVADDENDCLLKALALGRVLQATKEGKVKKNTNFFKASYQRSEMANFIEELRADEYLHNSSTVLELVNKLVNLISRQIVVVSPPNDALPWRIWKNSVRAKHSNNFACQCMTETSWGHFLRATTLKVRSTLICCTIVREAMWT